MHKNVLWLAFLSLSAVITLVYMGIAAYHLTTYNQLSRQAPLETLETSIIKKAADAFTIEVQYAFEANGRQYRGVDHLTSRSLLNHWAAEQVVAEFQASTPKVWYAPTNPQLSALERHFPLRELISAAFLLVLEIYFIRLGFRVGRHFS